MARVLWVSAETPDRDGQGGQRRQYHQILALIARGHQITVVVPHSPQSDHTIRRLTRVRRPRITVRGRVVQPWYSRLQRLIAEPTWDAVVVAHCESWWLMPPPERIVAPVLLDVHNVMSHWHLDAGRDVQARAALEEEAHAIGAARAVTTCSETELRRLVDLHPRTVDKAFVAPLGVDPTEWPDNGFDRALPIVALFGSWSWRPNALGLKWFLREVWPRVRDRVPDASAFIAGTGIEDVKEWPQGAHYVGKVSDLAAFVASATVVAVPVLEGVGASVKFAEALASGASVVATPDGSNAFENTPAFVATRSEEWAIWIAKRLKLRTEEHVPADARVFALRELTWDRAVEPIDRWLRAQTPDAVR
ncbi:glycosyltransferase family 4 protein [Humibacter sp. RRB41]|uniref:glycosyltransferase family 4 protein n=1 Tax=Humibacter sp. RRB41 TaxID=2919946 RepID=UPI001FAA1747|nr:glycosyltransferase family 4 protein [Humibacter sp. RRB41]